MRTNRSSTLGRQALIKQCVFAFFSLALIKGVMASGETEEGDALSMLTCIIGAPALLVFSATWTFFRTYFSVCADADKEDAAKVECASLLHTDQRFFVDSGVLCEDGASPQHLISSEELAELEAQFPFCDRSLSNVHYLNDLETISVSERSGALITPRAAWCPLDAKAVETVYLQTGVMSSFDLCFMENGPFSAESFGVGLGVLALFYALARIKNACVRWRSRETGTETEQVSILGARANVTEMQTLSREHLERQKDREPVDQAPLNITPY